MKKHQRLLSLVSLLSATLVAIHVNAQVPSAVVPPVVAVAKDERPVIDA